MQPVATITVIDPDTGELLLGNFSTPAILTASHDKIGYDDFTVRLDFSVMWDHRERRYIRKEKFINADEVVRILNELQSDLKYSEVFDAEVNAIVKRAEQKLAKLKRKTLKVWEEVTP